MATDTDTVRDVAELTPIHRDTDAEEVALGAYDLLFGLLHRLPTAAWGSRTECPAWDVSAMVGHMVGAAKSNASMLELLRQQVRGKLAARRFDGNALDAVNALQVDEHAHLSPAERLRELREVHRRAVAGRVATPSLLRRVDLPVDTTGSTAPGTPGTLSMGRLVDVTYTRDVWMHGVDIERATGVEVVREGDVDRRVVEDVVLEWATLHDQPFELHLTGPAGGRFAQGSDGVTLELDAVEFCRVLAGRAEGEGLLSQRLWF